VRLANGERLEYDRLVIASGSRLFAPLEGVGLPGIYNFKSLSAATDLVGRVKSGQAHTALIVGAGFIGMEIALLLSELGVRVTQIEMLDQVMPAMLDPLTAETAQQIMQQKGVELHLNTKARRFSGNGRADGVELETGQVLRADILVAATGVRPNLDFLEGSGIAQQWGIRVDSHLRATYPDVYAAGDVIEAPDRMTGEAFVHAILPNAVEQGKVVGLNLLGYDVHYEGAERMNSLKHLGLPIMAVGLKEGDQMLRRRINGGWRTLYLKENRLVGFQLVGDLRAAGAFRTLLNRRDEVQKFKDHLMDENFGQGMLVWEATRT
jgi:NADPH-dependent 2,4-dienoyl-CoA reductase/sulfur reductase-like enzyme